MITPEDIREVDPQAASGHLEAGDALFLDVRDPASFQEAHIPGAVHVDNDGIQRFLAETPKAQKIIVYCYHGNMSRGGAAYLMENGFEDVFSMSGGFEAWRGNYPDSAGD